MKIIGIAVAIGLFNVPSEFRSQFPWSWRPGELCIRMSTDRCAHSISESVIGDILFQGLGVHVEHGDLLARSKRIYWLDDMIHLNITVKWVKWLSVGGSSLNWDEVEKSWRSHTVEREGNWSHYLSARGQIGPIFRRGKSPIQTPNTNSAWNFIMFGSLKARIVSSGIDYYFYYEDILSCSVYSVIIEMEKGNWDVKW